MTTKDTENLMGLWSTGHAGGICTTNMDAAVASFARVEKIYAGMSEAEVREIFEGTKSWGASAGEQGKSS